MSDVKSNTPKLYKNPHREESTTSVGHYTPQYQKMGLTPKKVGGNDLVANVLILNKKPLEDNNPRTRVPTMRKQPYAESVTDKLTSSIPNVGNSMDYTWSGVDGDILDDLEIDPNAKMIDNNNIVSDELEVRDDSFANFNFDGGIDLSSKTSNLNVQKLDSILGIDEGQYILLVDDSVVFVGNKDETVALASSLVFGEHDICEGNPIPVDNISILKKIPIKIGLFLE